MRLKQISFLLVLLAVLASCGNNGNKFHIKGSIANMPEQTVYLQELNVDKTITVDSAKSDKAGKFDLSASAPEPGLYRLAFSDNHNKFIIFSADKSDVTVNGDWNNIELAS